MHTNTLPRAVGRHYTRDNGLVTYGNQPQYVMDSRGRMHAIGQQWGRGYDMPAYYTPDGTMVGNRTYDSAGAFLVGELERLDYTLHEPLVDVKYLRDIDLREDVTIGDEISSFTTSSFAAAGGAGDGNGIGNGKSWVGRSTTQISGVSVDIDKTPLPLHPWAQEVKYSLLELESAARVGRPVDQQKYAAMKLKHQMDTDEQVYIGDTVFGDTGLVNSSAVTPTNVANGAQSTPAWTTKTADEILADFNTALQTVWQNSAWAVVPNRVLLPPAQYGYISTQKVSQAGDRSILTYVLENNVVKKQGGNIDIFPSKWCIGAGAGGTIGTAGNDRMVVYTKDQNRVRFPMTLLSSTPLQQEGIYLKTTYYGRLGVLENIYPQCMGYFDLI